MQPFKVLRGLKEVHVRMPNHRGSGSALEVPFDQQELVFGDDGMIQSQLRCIEEAKGLMTAAPAALVGCES